MQISFDCPYCGEKSYFEPTYLWHKFKIDCESCGNTYRIATKASAIKVSVYKDELASEEVIEL